MRRQRTLFPYRAVTGRAALMLLLALLAISAPSLRGQSQTTPGQTAGGQPQTTPDQPPPPPIEPERKDRLVKIGFRVRGFPMRQYSVMGNKTAKVITSSPLAEWDFETNSRTRAISGGFNLNVRMGRHFMWDGEFIWQPLKYTKITNLYQGTARTLTTTTERTEASLWDIPVMLQYRPRASHGIFKNIFFAGGPTLSHVREVKTNTSTDNPDGSTSSSSTPAVPAKKNLFGYTGGVGFRWVDDFGINLVPEVRYTRWAGRTFEADSTQSPRNQLEIGLSFTF